MKTKQKLKVILFDLAKKNNFLRYIFRNILYSTRYVIYLFSKIKNKVKKKTVMFISYLGRGYSCSPKAIYEYMLRNKKYKDYTFIWAFKDIEKHKYLLKNKNTKIVNISNRKFESEISKCEYIVSNWRLPDYIYPKKNQKFIQCWHGTPLKKLGYDIESGKNALNTIKQLKYKYKIDAKKMTYMISPSKFATEKFISAFNLKSLNKENIIIQKGYPRNDKLYNYTSDDVKKIKEELKIENINKKIILYAPTWRDNQHTSGVGYTYNLNLDFNRLKKEISDEYIILFRPHYLIANSFDFESYKGFVYNVSDVEDINELYIISDILITDYSSVFFDYANLRRPIIFYMYDLEFYMDTLRGFYIDLKELPGPIVKNEDNLIDSIKNISNFELNKILLFNKKYNYLEDGQATKRVVKEVFKYE